MTKKTGLVLLFGAIAAFSMLSSTFHPRAQEVSEDEPRAVTESEMETYIEVYKAMQGNHDLTIEDAIRPHAISLREFRQLEQRIQKDVRLVDRTREALLDFARQHSAYAQAGAPTPSAIPTPTPEPTQPQ